MDREGLELAREVIWEAFVDFVEWIEPDLEMYGAIADWRERAEIALRLLERELLLSQGS